MPDFDLVPVDHDPFMTDQDGALAGSMTHYPESPNPAQPYIQGTKDFLKGGLSEVLKGQGVQLPDWSNRVGDVLQSEAANTAIGMAAPLKGVGALEKAAAESPSITAYHGSPHDFENFDLSRIGTGEGGQSFGHGLYFAENEGVAKEYKNSIAPKNFGSVEEDKAFKVLQSYGGNRDVAVKNLRAEAASLREQAERRKAEGLKTGGGWNVIADQSDAAADLLEKGWRPPEGKMYQVSIKADPEHFLDWDKPLSEQSEKVKSALKQLGQSEGNKYLPRTGEVALKSLRTDLKSDEAVTSALRQAGIPGIKYLDQGSRAGGEGTRNFVVFDDKLIDILKKYGIAGIGALPAMGAYHFQDKDLRQ